MSPIAGWVARDYEPSPPSGDSDPDAEPPSPDEIQIPLLRVDSKEPDATGAILIRALARPDGRGRASSQRLHYPLAAYEALPSRPFPEIKSVW